MFLGIIIAQPEDNLDNQSVYNKLVPCIYAAKQKRQVIIVTHNPNIAVSCNAEQIICCQVDKNTHSIKYIYNENNHIIPKYMFMRTLNFTGEQQKK